MSTLTNTVQSQLLNRMMTIHRDRMSEVAGAISRDIGGLVNQVAETVEKEAKKATRQADFREVKVKLYLAVARIIDERERDKYRKFVDDVLNSLRREWGVV